MLHQIKAQQFYLLISYLSPTENSKIQRLFNALK